MCVDVRGLEFLSLTGKVEGKRDRGKQRIIFLDSLCNSATGGQSKGLNFLKLSDDRDVWRDMAASIDIVNLAFMRTSQTARVKIHWLSRSSGETCLIRFTPSMMIYILRLVNLAVPHPRLSVSYISTPTAS